MFTLHVDFLAGHEEQARFYAEEYVRALNILRSEVECFRARVSADGDWSRLVSVFCGAPGPDATDVCTDSAGHPGWHNGPGASGRWSGEDVPRMPDVVDG